MHSLSRFIFIRNKSWRDFFLFLSYLNKIQTFQRILQDGTVYSLVLEGSSKQFIHFSWKVWIWDISCNSIRLVRVFFTSAVGWTFFFVLKYILVITRDISPLFSCNPFLLMKSYLLKNIFPLNHWTHQRLGAFWLH